MLDKSNFVKEVMSPFSGQTYTIRRVSRRDLIAELGILPTVLSRPVEEDMNKTIQEAVKAKGAQDPDSDRKIREFMLRHGVKEPKVHLGDEAGCPPDALCVAEMGDDAYWLASQVIEFSWEIPKNFMERFFRDSGTGDHGPGGEAVRSEAVGPPADGSPQGGNGTPVV